MKKRILNKNCSFTCPFLKGTISQTQVKPHRCKNGIGNFLTTETALNGNGICSISPAQPMPCSLKMAKNWKNGIEEKKKINGTSILNEDAKMICPVGGIIRVQKATLPPTSSMPVSSMAMLSTPTGGVVGSGSAATVAGNATQSKASPQSKKIESKQPEQFNQTEQSNSFSEKKEPEKEWTEKPKPKELQEQSTGTPDSINLCLCSYDTCGKAASCPYVIASSIINTNGASSKLRNNSSRKEADYNERANRNMEKGKISWNNQAHHMIPVKAYCRYPELVKLGNYFGYDINCEENCYFLPCWESGDGYGKKTSHYKKAQAYEVMHASGLQWHVGQHSYQINIPDKIKEKYPEFRTIECYNDKINKDIKKILSACNQRFSDGCLVENYEEHKSWFLEKMNALSEEIEEHLDLFGGKAKDSFPYFVSMEALRYAYEIPRSGKVILLYQTATKWNLKKYQYTNYLKNEKIQLNFLDMQDIPVAENHRSETIKKMILFCENITCFLIADEKKAFQLPFQYHVNYQYICNSELEKIESHFSALLAEQKDAGEEEYIAPKAMVTRRLKECGLL